MSGKKLFHNKKAAFVIGCLLMLLIGLFGRLVYLMICQGEYYSRLALDLHQRERQIKAARGNIYDRNGTELAGNRQVCTVSVIRSQITEEEKVISFLTEVLELEEEEVRKKVGKNTAREIIKSNVEKATGDEIRLAKLDGVKVDEDYKRYYPYDGLASKVMGFCGADNQGILGLEVEYEDILAGTPGKILTLTDYKGVELADAAETRIEPVDGNHLYLTIDANIQQYVMQAAQKVMIEKEAVSVSVILMNPQNGEIYAMADLPEYDLNNPFTEEEMSQEELNRMWRNTCVSDTYEPGSTFKIVTACAALSEGLVTEGETFSCPGYRIVEDRKIRCHKTTGHGTETFKEGIMNSCNPVFMDLGARLGRENMYRYWEMLGLFGITGVDVPGEAGSITHKIENIKAVELATMSFGQSFQITPLQLLRAAAAVVNGGTLVTPHFGLKTENVQTGQVEMLTFKEVESGISQEVSLEMRELLEAVVAEGTGMNGAVEGYRVGGKTATSQKLPRSEKKYIASFLGFAPADDPIVMGLILINEPTGLYYGGTIAAPVMKEIFENVLPYLNCPEKGEEGESLLQNEG